MPRVLSLLLTLLVVAGAGSPTAASPRIVTAESVEVGIRTMTPLNPQPGKTLRMAGTVRNRSADAVTAIQVRLLLSPTPMSTRSEIGTVAAGATDRDGPPTLAVSEPLPVLAPRTSGEWALEIPLDELPLFSTGVYVVGLEVIGTGTDGLTQRLGLTRTFLPWFPEGSVQPARLAWLWPVSGIPDRALDGVQLSERSAAEMAPGGRLSRIVTAAGAARVTWVFDPCVLQTAEDMVDGYEVVTGPADSQTTAGSGAALAQEWLDAVRQAAGEQASAATAYALPDASALVRAGMSQTVVDATERAAADTSAAVRTSVDRVLAWPPGGFTTPEAMRTFRDAGATDLLLADAALPATPGLTYTPDGYTTWGGMPVTLADSGLTAALAMPQDTRSQALLARQRFLSEIAMSAGELPDAPRSIVAAPDPLWGPRNSFLVPDPAGPRARSPTRGWSAGRRLAGSPSRWPAAGCRTAPSNARPELPRDYLAAVQLQQRDARRFEAILAEPGGVAYDQSVMRQTAGAWRTDQQGGGQLVRTVSEQVTRRTAQVRVATTGTFTLPGDTGRIPVTVANDLDQDVTVGIRLESDEPARLQAPDIAAFDVPAGRKVSLEVEAKVVGSGTLPVRIQLTTPGGRRYGDPVTVQVRTTAYSRAAAYVVSGAFVILAFLLGMNFVRRSKARQEHT